MEFATGLTEHALRVGDLDRSFLVYAPAQWSQGGSVVIALHGAGSSAADMVEFCGLNRAADLEGFLVVYPNGTGRMPHALSWNAGAAKVWAARNNIDDVGFMQRLLDQVLEASRADASRVYATGMSNGGLLCFRLACELPERLAAIAPVAISQVGELRPPRPMPVIHFHGTADDFVPYAGGLGRKSLTQTTFLSVQQTLDTWVRANGCDAERRIELPQHCDDGTKVVRTEFTGGAAPVVHYQVVGGGHTWPGQQSRYDFLGRVTQNLSANETICEFFRNYSR
jgi:polyhydroxybutyrate depolymerase